MKINKQDGIDYEEKDHLKRAKKVDLITLPKKTEGTNCANCKFFKMSNTTKESGFCNNPDIKLPVNKRMCCALWDADGSIRSWEKEEKEK